MIFLLGIALSILSGSLYFIRNAFSKKITNSDISPSELTGMQNIFGTLIFLLLLLGTRSNPFGRTNDIPLFLGIMFLIGILGYIGVSLQYKAIKMLPLSTITISYDLVPIVTTIIAFMLLSESLSWYDILGIIITTTGILLIDFNKLSIKRFSLPSPKRIFQNKSIKIIAASIFAFSLLVVLQKKALLLSGEALPVFFFTYFFVTLITSKSIIGLRHKTGVVKKNKKEIIVFLIVAILAFMTGVLALQYIPVGISSAMKGFITPFLVLTATLRYKEGNLKQKLFASGVIGSGIVLMSIF